MELFKEKPKFDFIGKRTVAFAFSGILIATSLGIIVTRGLNWGIDFTGGSMVQVTFASPVTLPQVRDSLSSAGYGDAVPQHFVGSNSYAIRTKGSSENADKDVDTLVDKFKAAAPTTFTVDRREYVGPTIGRHLYKQAVFAVVFSLLGIVAYVAFRFSNPLWGLAGILALAHDVTVTLGLFALLQLELNLILVAAILTIAGYSINDSIVIFDRLREKLRVMRRESLAEVLNVGINETLSRTMITSATTFFTAVALFILGGSVIHDFALTLCVGVLVGTYSSIGLATPIVYVWEMGRTKGRASGTTIAQSESEDTSGPRGKRERRKQRNS
jgi:preprotein translocase subunit SecF